MEGTRPRDGCSSKGWQRPTALDAGDLAGLCFFLPCRHHQPHGHREVVSQAGQLGDKTVFFHLSLPVRAQPLLSIQHVINASAVAFQQIFPPLLATSWALAGGESQVLPATFLALQDPVHQTGSRVRLLSPTPASPGLAGPVGRALVSSQVQVGQIKPVSLWLTKGSHCRETAPEPMSRGLS